jgi:hypothetical protein
MKIKLKLSQLKRILEIKTLKFPITFRAEDFTQAELSEFYRLIESNEGS